MVEENKYYTPILEEFHIGFEYERDGVKKGEQYWWPCIFGENPKILLNGNNEYCLITDRDLENCRVKYLDQSDIESLGWKLEFDDMFGEDKYKLKSYIITSIFKNNQIVDISLLPIFKGQGLSRVFRGTIKNKSELKVLMKQLGINE